MNSLERIVKIASEVGSELQRMANLAGKYIDTDTVSNSTFQSPKRYLVSNTTGLGEYTPSVFETLDEATDWLKECSVRNFIEGWGRQKGGIKFHDSIIEAKLSGNNKDHYKFMKVNGLLDKFIENVINSDEYDGSWIKKYSSLIIYPDDTFNEMHIFEMDFSGDKPTIHELFEHNESTIKVEL